MPEPIDKKLYNKIKKEIYKKIPNHSAYRSGILVKKYKEKFADKYGNKKSPYKGTRTKKKGLKRWFDEEWVNQRGEVGYKYKNDIYRPKYRITDKTPTTHEELTKNQIKKARTIKYRKGRVNEFKILGGGKTQKLIKPTKKEKKIYFKDYPDFLPNLTPMEMFKLGSFGGTYWRPIYSSINKKDYKNVHKKYPESWWKDIPESWLTTEWENYDTNINKYKVKVGTTLEFWEEKEWIKPIHPYGWVEWYCDFYMGKRSHDDERQIARWKKLAGNKGRFMRFLVTQILKNKSSWDDETVSPKIRQVLQHWGYKLTEEDYKYEVNRRKE